MTRVHPGLVRRSIRRVHRRMGEHPALLPVVLRLTPLGTARTLTTNTDLVVEGFPRSGNTFLAFSLRHANPQLEIISHAHVPAQVIRAMTLDLPAIVVVREPVATLASLLVAAPHVTAAQAWRDHIRHHRALIEHRHLFVVARFSEVVGDQSAIVRRLNDRFGTDVSCPSPEDAQRVLAVIDQHHASVHPGASDMSPRPDPSRAGLIDTARSRLLVREHAACHREAQHLYEVMLTAP